MKNNKLINKGTYAIVCTYIYICRNKQAACRVSKFGNVTAMGHVLKIRPCASKTFAGKLQMMRPNEFLWKLLGTWVGITHGKKKPHHLC